MNNTILQALEPSKSILVLLPKTAYFDQVAAALSLYLTFGNFKETTIVSPTPMTVEMNRLIGVNKITDDIGSKNLVISFGDYDGKDIERVSADLEDGKFFLTVIPKPGVKAPSKENMVTDYSGVSADTVILVGGANDSHFPVLNQPEFANLKLIHVGNRPLNTTREVQSFVRDASSVSEIVGEMFILAAQSGAFTIHPDIATNLVMGIEDASKGFSTPETNADTFNIFANLLRLGGQRKPKAPDMNQFPEGSIPEAKPTRDTSEKRPNDEQVTVQKPVQDVQSEATPKDWLKPKIFKGTSTK